MEPYLVTIVVLLALGLLAAGIFLGRSRPTQLAPANPSPPSPSQPEEDPQKVLARQMAEEAKQAAADLALASNEVYVARMGLQAKQRRDEAEKIRVKIYGP